MTSRYRRTIAVRTTSPDSSCPPYHQLTRKRWLDASLILIIYHTCGLCVPTLYRPAAYVFILNCHLRENWIWQIQWGRWGIDGEKGETGTEDSSGGPARTYTLSRGEEGLDPSDDDWRGELVGAREALDRSGQGHQLYYYIFWLFKFNSLIMYPGAPESRSIRKT